MDKNNQEIKNSKSIDESRKELINKLMNCDLESDYEAFKEVIDSCSEDLKEYMFQDAFMHFIFNNKQEALKIINDSCPEELRTIIFAGILKEAVLDQNQKVFDTIYKAYPKDSQIGLLAAVLLFFVKKGKQEAVKIMYEIFSNLPLKADVFSTVLITCLSINYKDAIAMLIGDCSKNFQIDVLSNTLSHFAKKDDQPAVKMMYESFSNLPFLKIDIFSNALLKCALSDNPEAVNMITNIWLHDLKKDDLESTSKIDMLADALLKLALFKNQERFQTITDAFSVYFKMYMPVTLKKYSYIEQKEVKKTKEEIDEEKDIALKDFKNKVFSSILNKVTVLKNVERARDMLIDTSSEGLDTDFHRNKNNYSPFVISLVAIDVIVENCSSNEDLINIFSSSLSTQSALKDKEAVKILAMKCPVDVQKEIFLEALKSLSFFNKKDEIEILIHVCADDLKKHIFINALKHYALNNFGGMFDNSFDRLVSACPEAIKSFVFTQILNDTDIKNNPKALNMVKNAYRVYLEKNKFLKALEDKDQEAIDKVIENCPENLKLQLFTQVLLDFALEKNQKKFEMIVKNFPYFNLELRENVFKSVMSDSAIKSDDNARYMIESAYKKYSIRNKFIELLQEKN